MGKPILAHEHLIPFDICMFHDHLVEVQDPQNHWFWSGLDPYPNIILWYYAVSYIMLYLMIFPFNHHLQYLKIMILPINIQWKSMCFSRFDDEILVVFLRFTPLKNPICFPRLHRRWPQISTPPRRQELGPQQECFGAHILQIMVCFIYVIYLWIVSILVCLIL